MSSNPYENEPGFEDANEPTDKRNQKYYVAKVGLVCKTCTFGTPTNERGGRFGMRHFEFPSFRNLKSF